jgi:hypothetical protein
MANADEALEHDVEAGSHMKDHEQGSNWKARELFAVDCEDFNDLLAALKVRRLWCKRRS